MTTQVLLDALIAADERALNWLRQDPSLVAWTLFFEDSPDGYWRVEYRLPDGTFHQLPRGYGDLFQAKDELSALIQPAEKIYITDYRWPSLKGEPVSYPDPTEENA